MKNIRDFLSETFHFLVAKCSVYLNRLVFVMNTMDVLFVIANLFQSCYPFSRIFSKAQKNVDGTINHIII